MFLYTVLSSFIHNIAIYKEFLILWLFQNLNYLLIYFVSEHVSEQMMYVLFWGTASVISLGVMYMFGTEFVDQPRLVHTKLKMD